MSNVIFELFAKLGLDSSEYEKGLQNAKSNADSIGGKIAGGLKTVAKASAVAFGAATTAAGAFAASSVKTGQAFDKSMSQVAATMGLTMEEMANQTGKVDLAWGTFSGNLREYAQEMGKNTAFSATEAADALNYMALAGYDVQTSMEMLPNVLNLAAAGNMDLARASDMVTDTQTAFGISLERTSQMVDEMAKAASTGNTSVEQLGDAFLVVGGLAQELNGGFINMEDGSQVAYDNVQELEIALTAMANAGIKGSEAGTHMRNMLLKLASPTEDGYKAFTALGVSVFDSEGKMRSLAGIMEDLDSAMANLTQEEKLQAISDIFNTRDTAAAEALLNAVGDDWAGIAESILDADGAAQQMADTQLDNLAGDVTLFKSALEGAQIAVSDKLTPSLRDFVKFGTDGLSTLTSAFTEGGIDKAMDKFGGILSDGITMIIEKTPMMVSAGIKLLSAFIKGFTKNKKKVFDAAREIIKAITDTISKEFPSFKSIMGNIQKVFDGVFGWIEKNSTLIQSAIKGILVGFMAYTAAITVFSSLQKGIGLVSTAVKVLNGQLALSSALNPYAAIAATIGVVIGLMVTLDEKEKAEMQARHDMAVAISDRAKEAGDHARDYIQQMNDMYESNMNVKRSIEEQLQPEQDLIEELKEIVDANGKVKEGYEERAQVITDQLAQAFDTEIQYQDGVIQKYDEVMGKLDELIAKKKGEALLDANKEAYSQALSDQINLFGDLRAVQDEYNGTQKEYEEALHNAFIAQDELNKAAERGSPTVGEWGQKLQENYLAMEESKEKLAGLKTELDDAGQAYYKNQDFIADYNNLLEVTTSGTGDVTKAVTDMTNGIIEAAPQDILKGQAEEAINNLQALLDAKADGVAVTEQQIADATATAQAAIDALTGAGQDGQAGYAKGLEEDTDVIDAAKKMVEDGLVAVELAQDSHSPSKEYADRGVDAMQGYGGGMLTQVGWLRSTANSIIRSIEAVFINTPSKSYRWGADMMSSFINGVKSKVAELEQVITSVANLVKDNLGHSHPKKGPLADDYTWMPDMMELFAQGIRDNKQMLLDTVTDAFNFQDLITAPTLAMNNGTTEEVGVSAGFTQINNIYSPTALTPSEVARQTRNATRDMVLELRGKR